MKKPDDKTRSNISEFDREEFRNAVKESAYEGTTSLRITHPIGGPVEFRTDNADLMQILLNHDRTTLAQIQVITQEGPSGWMQPSEYGKGQIKDVKVEFDPQVFNDGIDSDIWGRFFQDVSVGLKAVGVTTDCGGPSEYLQAESEEC